MQCKHVLFSAYQDDGSNDDVRLPAKLQVSYSTSTRAFSPFNFDVQGQVEAAFSSAPDLVPPESQVL